MRKAYQNEDFCENCAELMKSNGLPPHLLAILPHGTIRNDLEVRVCPYCDGDAVQLGERYV